MAVARDQAARMLRSEPETADREAARDDSAALAESLRSHVAEETKRRPSETPVVPAGDKPASAAPTNSAAPKSSNRKKLVLMGVGLLLALAAASYGVHYLLVGRFYVSTDDAYVRANSTMLGARVSGHIAAILPADNTVVRTGTVIFRIDDGDYRIAVDAVRTRIATQQVCLQLPRRRMPQPGHAFDFRVTQRRVQGWIEQDQPRHKLRPKLGHLQGDQCTQRVANDRHRRVEPIADAPDFAEPELGPVDISPEVAARLT